MKSKILDLISTVGMLMFLLSIPAALLVTFSNPELNCDYIEYISEDNDILLRYYDTFDEKDAINFYKKYDEKDNKIRYKLENQIRLNSVWKIKYGALNTLPKSAELIYKNKFIKFNLVLNNDEFIILNYHRKYLMITIAVFFIGFGLMKGVEELEKYGKYINS